MRTGTRKVARGSRKALAAYRFPPSAFWLRRPAFYLIACVLVVCSPLVHLLAQNSSSRQSGLESAPPPASLHQWGALTLFHGLPSDRVRAIAQGDDGVIWFGTDAGLVKYDGRRIQSIASAGITAARVLSLKFDADQALWIGTEAGAARMAGAEFRPIKESSGKAITAIATPERGHVILASDQGLLLDCQTSDDGQVAVHLRPGQAISSADADHRGPLRFTSLATAGNALYAGSLSRGLVAFQGDTAKEIQSRPRPYFVEALEGGPEGQLWLGVKAKSDESGLYDARDPLHPFRLAGETGTVTALRAHGQDDLWVGTDGHGAFHYRGSRLVERFTFEGTAGGLRSDQIYSIFIDRDDVVWFGTDKGVCRYDPHALRLDKLSDNAESNFVRTLFRTRAGKLLCGTNSGLFLYDQPASAWRAVKQMSRRVVYAIAEDKDGRLLVGTAGGLYSSSRPLRDVAEETRLTPVETDENEDPDTGESATGNSVRAISQFQGQTHLVTFGRGLERIEGGIRKLVWPLGPANAPEREVVSLHADQKGTLWFGTARSGLFSFDGKQAVGVLSPEKFGGGAVWSISSDDDSVWVATAHGLFRLRAGELSGVLPGYDIRHVVVAGGGADRQIWCATAGGGLIRVRLDEQFGVLTSRLDAEQGLPSQRVFAVLPESDGHGDRTTCLVGTSRGVARYEPGRNSPGLGPTRILGKRIHGMDELRSGILLDYPQNSLVLDVAAMSSRTFPEQFQYAFLLVDRAGRVIRQKLSHDSQFTMEGLGPGRYRVLARAYTVDLTASAPFTFEFEVAGAPFPWASAALSVLLALALIALLWGYLQNRRLARTGAALMDANRQLADARLQLANETEAERRRIARDLHDQTLADLRRLLMLTDQMGSNGKGDSARHGSLNPVAMRAEIESISHEVRRICEDLSPSVLENVGLAAALEWALANTVAHSPPERKFEYEFVCDDSIEERNRLPPSIQMQIYRIAQEAINNICRHASANHVRLTVDSAADGSFLLRLEDDGRDFDPQDRKKRQGRGLANIRSRASLIDAQVSWSHRPEGGTLFTLRRSPSPHEMTLH